MKKLLGIVVLGFLWCENVFARYYNMSEEMKELGVWFGLIVVGLIFGACYLYEVYKDKKIYNEKKRKKIIFWGVVGLIFGACYLYEVYKEKDIYNEKKRKKIINQKRADDLFKD